MLAAALYRPLQFISDNAWDLDSPFKPVLIGVAVGAVGLLLLFLLTRLGANVLAASLGISTALLILFFWQDITIPLGLKVALPIVVFLITARLARTTNLNGLAFVALAIFGLYPLVQLVLSHIEQSEPYPIVTSPRPNSVQASGRVEDVIFLVVDTYPSFTVADSWLGHDNAALREAFDENAFETPDLAWSQLTFTFLSVSSILELRPVAIPGPLPPWRNESSVRQLLRGDNLVAASLQSAGFEYTHIESGLSGLGCGPLVDRCIPSHWLDEATWLLLWPSILARPLDSQFGYFSLPDTLEAAEHLEQVAAEAATNGVHDYVFAHFFLPHPPIAADQDCGVLESVLYVGDGEDRRADDAVLDTFSGQLACADRLVARIAATAAPDTAMLITADHGPGLGGQVNRDGSTWSDDDIAERLSTMLAYHLPSGCPPPEDQVNIDVMRAIMACATDLELPPHDTTVFLGADNPYVVGPNRIADIRRGVEDATINPFAE